MSSLPEISGVMSAYNGLDGFRETMDSVLSQEGVSLEFIIIDDGSTDGTNVALANYARHDTRVRSLTRALIKGKMEQKAYL
jgi:glycosyltransferase involved in cell wall biosynthesis